MGYSQYNTEVLKDNPKVYYPLQEAAGFAVDVVGGNNFDHITGILGYQQPGPASDCFSLHIPAGCNQYKTVVTTVTDNLTLEIWYSPTFPVASTQKSIFGVCASPVTNGYGIVTGGAAGKWAVLLGGVATLSDSSIIMTGNSWYHLVATRDAGTWKYYSNGQVDNANVSGSAPIAPSANYTALNILIDNDIYISQAAVYETALSANRIALHYQAMLGYPGISTPSRHVVAR